MSEPLRRSRVDCWRRPSGDDWGQDWLGRERRSNGLLGTAKRSRPSRLWGYSVSLGLWMKAAITGASVAGLTDSRGPLWIVGVGLGGTSGP